MRIRLLAFLLALCGVMTVTFCACRASKTQDALFFDGIETFHCTMEGKCNETEVKFTLQRTAKGVFLLTYLTSQGAGVSYRLTQGESSQEWQGTAIFDGMEIPLSSSPPMPLAMVQIFTLNQTDLRECEKDRAVFVCEAGEVEMCSDLTAGVPVAVSGTLYGVEFSLQITDFAKGTP